VSKLTVNDLGAFYKTNYNPNHAAISIVGDFNSKEMKAALTVLMFLNGRNRQRRREYPKLLPLSKKTGYY
jgi:predicted Zn-dependent peptidase